jgi:hypothetical protein
MNNKVILFSNDMSSRKYKYGYTGAGDQEHFIFGMPKNKKMQINIDGINQYGTVSEHGVLLFKTSHEDFQTQKHVKIEW